ncbi:xanthine phosphoribosyltransferase [Orenia metallireducens]|jgi:xanthine phosphoribosyltransferase|uniref:Xanthine phosphoribosyltransferase n=1 Tax=Orenia metallireducens TaxID=1413210 RepID=A0A285IET5_9FIRM|nr:xanthine phosphoribosyltransferase [Orenia metallireducens]PRX28022.1 xanthine phosphoribosyltransferase [Orenia metallireducens]SNY45451.1 xanthine phosphoribosyltransferase [Orenia metallireducens]
MKLLKEKIKEDGKLIGSNILKVDSFLNHQIDPKLMAEIGKEFAQRFHKEEITKVLTIEASGIAVALMVGLELDVPVLFAKKKKASTMDGRVYTGKVESFTKNQVYDISVAAKYLNEDDKVLIIDDFLAMGQASQGLIEIVEDAQAKLAGVGIVIEKGFQPGGKQLRKQGVRVESLAIIESLEDNQISFA